MKKLNKKYGQWALVTGASSGIGKAITEQLAESGMNIVAVASNEMKLEKLKSEIQNQYSVQVETLSVDLSDSQSIDVIAEKTIGIDIGLVVANAGIENSGAFLNVNRANEERLVAININSPMQISHVFGKRLVQRGGGGLLLVSSLFGYQGIPYVANYAASKAYILSFGEALHEELKESGVDVTVVSPGLTTTSMTENMPIDFSKIPTTRHKPAIVAKIALANLGKKATVVVGIVNKIYAWENRFIPRSWPVKMFGFLIKRAIKSKELTNLKHVET